MAHAYAFGVTTQSPDQRNAKADPRPLVCILDASVAMTGALMAARREAYLLKDRAQFVLIIPASNSLPDSDLPEFTKVVRLPIRPLRRKVKDAVLYLPSLLLGGRALKATLDRLGCERLQINDFYLAQAWVARRMGFRGRIVTWVRIDPGNFGHIGKLWLKTARRSSDALVAVSRFIATRPGVKADALLFDPAPEVTAIRPNGQEFLFVGNYVIGKGQDLAISAFHRLAADFPDATLQLHGSTMGLKKNEGYLDRLRALAASGAGNGRIALDDFSTDLTRAYSGALAAINCSHSESFSLTCLEASAHGLPVIATRSGGPEEIIADEETGFLVDLGDVAALEQRMRKLLADPEMARRMGTAGRKRVYNQFGKDAFRDQCSKLLDI